MAAMGDDETTDVPQSFLMTTLAARVENSIPLAYRLRTQCSTVVLQGLFQWTEGVRGGTEWRDIPTVEGEERSE